MGNSSSTKTEYSDQLSGATFSSGANIQGTEVKSSSWFSWTTIFLLVLFLIIIPTIIALVMLSGKSNDSQPHEDSALEKGVLNAFDYTPYGAIAHTAHDARVGKC